MQVFNFNKYLNYFICANIFILFYWNQIFFSEKQFHYSFIILNIPVMLDLPEHSGDSGKSDDFVNQMIFNIKKYICF